MQTAKALPNSLPTPENDEAKEPESSLEDYLGQRLRMRRLVVGLSQEALAEMLGITFQQVQKYERGLNKLPATRLYELAKLLKTSMEYFFEGAPMLSSQPPGIADQQQAGLEDMPPNFDLASRETADLLRAYYHIDDETKRRRVLDLIRAMRDNA